MHNDSSRIHFYLLDRQENSLNWKPRGLHSGCGIYVWGPLEPGERGIVNYEAFDIPGYQMSSMRFNKGWDEIKSEGGTGHLHVTVGTIGHYTFEAPVGKIRNVTCPTAITIKPRPAEEFQMLEEFMTSEKYRKTARLVDRFFSIPPDDERLTTEEWDEVIDKMSPGTLCNKFKYLRWITMPIDAADEAGRIGRMWQMRQWLDTLHEIERESLLSFLQRESGHSKYPGPEARTAFDDFFGKYPLPRIPVAYFGDRNPLWHFQKHPDDPEEHSPPSFTMELDGNGDHEPPVEWVQPDNE